MIEQKKLLIIGDNLAGGGALLASTMIDEASLDPGVIELRGWVSQHVKISQGSKFQDCSPSHLPKLIPKWIRRALLAATLDDGWVVLNLTNFPISRLGIKCGVTEICLFHNAYFMASPKGIHSPIPFYFFFRQLLLRRALLKWLMFFYDKHRTKLVVQTHFMAELSKRMFGARKVWVASLHVPPMMDSSVLTEKLKSLEKDVNQAWFYPASAEPHKNHLLLIDICEKSVKTGGDPRIFITIRAKTREEEFILESINQRGLAKYIINIGWLNEAERQWLTTNCRGVLFLSTFESLGISLLEARLLERPILCVESPLAKEMLGDSFPFYDVARLDERNRLAHDLTKEAGSISKAPPLLGAKRIIDAYCFDHLDIVGSKV
jgi:hypothetical protein